MKKRRAFIFGILFVGIFLLGIFAAVLVNAQSSSSNPVATGSPYGINTSKLGSANGTIFSNPVLKGINGVLHAISPVFNIIMAQGYSFSVSFLVTLILWLFFFFSFNRIFKDYISLSPLIALGASFLLTVIIAHVKIIRGTSNFIVQIVFGTGRPWWMQAIFGVLSGLVLVVIFIVISSFGKAFAKKRKEQREFQDRLKLETGAKSGEALTKAMSSFEKR